MRPGWGLVAACAWLATTGLASAVPVTEMTVYARDSVRIQDKVMGDVGSLNGSVQVKGKASVSGDVSARGDVRVASSAVVGGGVNAGGTVKASGAGSVGGIIRGGLSSAQLATVLAGDLLPLHVFNSGGSSYQLKQGSLSLKPGSYGTISAKGAGALYLKSGDYYVDSLSAKGTRLMLDLSGGPISLYVSGNLSLNKSDVFVTDGSGDYVAYADADHDLAGLVYAEVHGTAKLSGAEWLGTMYTPDGVLQVNKAAVTGALYSGTSLSVKGNGHTIQYSPLLSGASGPGQGDDDGDGGSPGDPGIPASDPLTAVPEPMTLALLGVALAALAARRGKR